MTPLKLRLKNFIGIRDGMGRDEITIDFESVKGALVAIIGPNGTGKTTILDNATPFRLMASRASSYSVNAFSYWGQVYGGEAVKELVWSHAGVEYKSILILKSTGKTQKSEAYLQVWNETAWQPYSAGTLLSDGKNGTYDACIENILGSPELYFTAAFSAQGRKLLSGYTNAEIKSLLSSLLGLGHIEDLAVGANEKRLTAERRLQSIRDGGADLTAGLARFQAWESEYTTASVAVTAHGFARFSHREKVAKATDVLAAARSDLAQAEESGRRFDALRQQLSVLEGQEAAEIQEARVQRDKAQTRLTQGRQRYSERITSLKSRADSQERELNVQKSLLDRREEVEKAVLGVRDYEAMFTEADAAIVVCETEGATVKDAPAKLATIKGEVAGCERELTNLRDQLEKLKRRSALVDRVPCAGTDLQNTCELLADARTAKAESETVVTSIAMVEEGLSNWQMDLLDAEAHARRYAELQITWRDLNTKRNTILKTLEGYRVTAAMKASVDQADEASARIRMSLAETVAEMASAEHDWKAELTGLEQEATAAASKPLDVQAKYKTQRQPIQDELDSLTRAAASGADVAGAEQALRDAHATLDDIEKALDATKAQIAKLEAEKAQLDALAEKAASHEAAVTAAADDLAHWTTTGKALGPNGVIALEIDDAGPSLAVLINDLLRASYGPRFSVRIDTQHQNTDGTFREDFDIVVFDGEHGSSKSLTDCSPGQQIVLNDAICSGVAVHMSQKSSRDYECRMSDESDGALDADRKLQYMAMKREVLKLTGMQREFFISHSTATWELADAVIDLGQYVITNKQPAAHDEGARCG